MSGDNDFGLRAEALHLLKQPNVGSGRPGRLRGSAQFMQEWIEKAAIGGHVRIPAGDERDTWSYIEDVASAFFLSVRAATLPSQRIFNIGGDFRSRRELGHYLQRLVPEAPIDIGAEETAGGYRSTQHVNRRLSDALGFRLQWPLERGVKATVNWARTRAGLEPVD